MKSPRTKETEEKYKIFKDAKKKAGHDLTAFNMDEEIVVREFKHWLIIENRFPYDNMTSVNHMLIPKRELADYSLATVEEKEEHDAVLRLLAEENYYDALVENFPRSKSVHRHAHTHLVRWKYTNDDGKNKINENLK